MNKTNFAAIVRKQVGIGLGYLLLIIVLVVAIGAAAMKFSSDSTPSTSGQQAQLDAGTLANQIGTMRGNLTMLATSTTAAWTGFGPTTASPSKMALGSGSGIGAMTLLSGLDSSRQVAIPPKGETAAMTWSYSHAAASTDPIFMWTEADVPNAVCQQFNGAARGTVGELTSADLNGSTVIGAATTVVIVYPISGAFLTAGLAAGDAGCYTAAALGKGRVVARLR